MRPHPLFDQLLEAGESGDGFLVDPLELIRAWVGGATRIAHMLDATCCRAFRRETIANDDRAKEVRVRPDGPGIGAVIVQDHPFQDNDAATPAPLLAEGFSALQRPVGGFGPDRGLTPERPKVRIADDVVDRLGRRVDQDFMLTMEGYGHCCTFCTCDRLLPADCAVLFSRMMFVLRTIHVENNCGCPRGVLKAAGNLKEAHQSQQFGSDALRAALAHRCDGTNERVTPCEASALRLAANKLRHIAVASAHASDLSQWL